MSQLQTISEHLPPAMLVSFRLGGLMIFGPLFGSSVIPARVKVFLTLVLGVAVYPLLADRVLPPPASISLLSMAPLVAMELSIGLAIGYMASLPLVGIQTGGLLMGQQMGLGFARFFNPAINDQADIVGQMLFFMAIAGFLVVGGHEALVLAVLHSFEHVPLGGSIADMDLLGLVTGLLLSAFELALRVAAPLLAIIFLETVAMGFIAKTVPQLNILSLGFPIRILVGFAIVGLGLAVIDDVVMDEIDTMLGALFQWIGT